MKHFQHWLFASISLIGLVVMSSLYAQAQQTSVGQVQLEIGQGQSCCVYGTSVVFGEKEVNFGITEFTGDFLSYHGTNTWWCKDLLGTETGRAMYISLSGDMENGNWWIIPAENVKISFDATNLVWGDCEYTSNIAIDTPLSSSVPVVEKKEVTQNYGKICELGTSNVKLKVTTMTGQAPGNYVGTLVIDLPNFVTNTCGAELIGTFYDAETDWLAYVGNMWSAGITANSGTFSYKPGEQITFKIGNVTLGNPVTPAPNGSVFVTDLFGVARTEITDPNVIKVGKLLQGIDADNNPDNGITIESSVSSQFTENNNVTALDVGTKLTALSKPVRTAKQVVQHLERTAEEKLNEDINVGYSFVEMLPWLSNYSSKIMVDSWNNVYIAWHLKNENNNGGMVSFWSIELYNEWLSEDIFVGKKNKDWDWIWAIKWWWYGINDYDYIYDATIDSTGNSYVVGFYKGTGHFWLNTLSYQQYGGPFVAKISNDGNWIWATTGWYEIREIEVDQLWNSYVQGTYYTTWVFWSIVLPSEWEYSSSPFIWKIDTNGNWIWVKKTKNTIVTKINIDSQWYVYVVWSFAWTGNFGTTTLLSVPRSAFVAKMNISGDWLRATQSTTSINVSCDFNTNSSVIDSQWNIYILWTYSSYCEDAIHFGSTALTGALGEYTNLIAKIDSNWNRITAKKWIGWIGLAIDKNWFIYSAARFDDSITIWSTQLTNRWSSFSYNDFVGYLVKLNSSIEPVSAALFEWINPVSVVVDNINTVYILCRMSEANLVLWEKTLTGTRLSKDVLYKVPFRDKESTLLYETTPPEDMH